MLKLNNLGLALGMALEFYTSIANRLKLKVRMFLRLILMFLEVTEEKLVDEEIPPPPLILNRSRMLAQIKLSV